MVGQDSINILHHSMSSWPFSHMKPMFWGPSQSPWGPRWSWKHWFHTDTWCRW